MRSKYVEIHPASLIKKFFGKSRIIQYCAKKIASKFRGIPYETSFREFLSQNDVENLLWELNTETAKGYADSLYEHSDRYIGKLFKLPIEKWMNEIFKKLPLSCSLVNLEINEEDNLSAEVRTFGNTSEEEERKITEKIEDKVPYSVALVKSSKSPNYLLFLAADYKPSSAGVAYVISDKDCESYVSRIKQRKPLLEKGSYIVLADSWGFVVEEMGAPKIEPEESVSRVEKSVRWLDEELDEELLDDVLFLEKAFP